MSNDVEKLFTSQLKYIEDLDKSCEKWNSYYQKQDFDNMKKEFTKIEKNLKNIIPLENTINKAKQIENLQSLIQSKGSFDLSAQEIELTKKLI